MSRAPNIGRIPVSLRLNEDVCKWYEIESINLGLQRHEFMRLALGKYIQEYERIRGEPNTKDREKNGKTE